VRHYAVLDANRLALLPAARNATCGSVALALLVVASPAQATYSIVAADATAREVGGTVTSCVAPQSVQTVYRSAPGHGAIHAQALVNTAGRDRGVALLEAETAPADVIAQIATSSFDARFQSRQYGVVDLSGRAAGFTGSSAQEYRADRQGSDGTYVYSVQGNILTSARVLDQAEAGFKVRGCDLAERLMLALEAGAQNGEGDSRCTTAYGIPSDASSIQVDRANEPAGSYLRLAFTSTNQAHENPIVRLRAQFDAWRTTHPCPGSSDGGGGGFTSGGFTSGGFTSGGFTSGGFTSGGFTSGGFTGGGFTSGGFTGGMPGGSVAGGGAAGAVSAGASSGGSANSAGGIAGSAGANAGTPGTGAAAAGNDGGCGCRVQQGRGRWSILLAAAGWLWLARRRRACRS
jgi:uncharacterized Ntn-hydrolase superfamily protein